MVEDVQALVTAKKLIAVAAFANSCDNKSEVKATFLAGTAFPDNLVGAAHEASVAGRGEEGRDEDFQDDA